MKKAGDNVTVPISPKITLQDVSSENSGNIKATSIADITATDRTIGYSTLTINKLHQYREKFSDLEEIMIVVPKHNFFLLAIALNRCDTMTGPMSHCPLMI